MPKAMEYADGGVTLKVGESAVVTVRAIQLEVRVMSVVSGAGIPSASIELDGPASVSGATDASGVERFSGLLPGKYTIACSAPAQTTTMSSVPDARMKSAVALLKEKETMVLFAPEELTQDEQAIVYRMLDLGATRDRVESVIATRRKTFAQRTAGSSHVEYFPENIQQGIEALANSHQSMVDDEFESLPGSVQASFQDPNQRASSEKEQYRKFRPHYRAAGYQPAKLLAGSDAGIDTGRLLNTTVQAQREVLTRLEQVQAQLGNKLNGIKEVGGFQPRTQYESGVLSNHALGLAIDVEAPDNPIITDPKVLDAIHGITGINPTTRFVILPSANDAAEGLFSRGDPLAAAYDDAKSISAKLKGWLKPFLEKQKVLDDALAKEQQLHEGEGDWEVAVADRIAAEQELQALKDWELFVVLRDSQEVQKWGGVEAWAERGVLSLPLEFVAEMSKQGFRWGGTYGNRKDYMHFELMDQSRTQPFIPPHEAAQSLQQFIDSVH